jgi:carbonic anhydrase/acetyltransferase-like protein (isoleucine patch superfamily)
VIKILINDLKRLIDPTVEISSTVIIKGDGIVIIESYCVIEDYVLIDTGRCGRVQILSRSKLKQGSVIRAYNGTINIGKRVTIGEYSILAGHGCQRSFQTEPFSVVKSEPPVSSV